MKIKEVGPESISQRHGSADPHQNVMDPQHWWRRKDLISWLDLTYEGAAPVPYGSHLVSYILILLSCAAVRNISPSRPYTPQKTLLRYCSNSFPHLGTMEPPIRRLSCIQSKINPLNKYCSWQQNLIFIPYWSDGVPNVVFFISVYQQLEKRETGYEFLL